MNRLIIGKKKLFLILVISIMLIPWFNSDSGFEQIAGTVSQESVAFYEINPCKVSLVQFLKSNPSSIYQDHYHFRYNNYSSINCFGRISGATVIDSDFYISVGTNSFINILLQSIFWIYLLSRIKRDNNIKDNENVTYYPSINHYISLLLTTTLFSFSIYAEKRFYEKSLYYFDFSEIFYKILITGLIFFILNNFISVFNSRKESFFTFIPYLYLFYSVFSGYNFTLFSTVLVYYGIISFLNNEINWKINKVLFVFVIWWTLNSRESFYFSPGKLRGFTSSIYEFNATIFWCLYFLLFINGLWYLFQKTVDYFDLQKFINNFSIVSIVILVLGFFGANFPIINFLNYYYFGQQKFGITRNNPFAFDSWEEKLSWRGFYSSAESIGEYYGLCLLFIAFSFYKKKSLNYFEIAGSMFSILGLYFSDNRTAMILVSIFIIYLFLKDTKYKKIGLMLSAGFLISLILYLIGFESFTYSYEFLKDQLFVQANFYQYDTVYSSFIIWMKESYNSNGVLNNIFSLFSVLAYFLNRSEMWGIFFARYNPTYLEMMAGSGPFNFGQLYGENIINKTESFLLPHSSLLSFLLFFGFIGIFLVFTLFSKLYLGNRDNISTFGKMLIIFMIINIIKNDVLNYFSSFTMYLFFFLAVLKTKNENIFRF
tara:strand:+ start:1180 stop:3144 length:1965 start_codon:yes stop_codon:yes gene_type:complete